MILHRARTTVVLATILALAATPAPWAAASDLAPAPTGSIVIPAPDPSGAQTTPITESSGQQSLIAADGTTATVQSVANQGGTLVLGGSRVLTAPAGSTFRHVAVDGVRIAYVTDDTVTSTLTVIGATAQPLQVIVPRTTYALSFSGSRLLVSDEQSSDYLPGVAFKGHSRLLDLNSTVVHWTTVPDLSSISGPWLAYEVSDGSVWLRNLDLPSSADKQLAPPAPGNNLLGDHGVINVSGDWVTWTDLLEDFTSRSGAYRISTGESLDRPEVFVQAHGLGAYVDDQFQVHLVDLASGTETLLARTAERYVSDLSLSGDVLFYVDAAFNMVLVPVGNLVTEAPRAVAVAGDTGVRLTRVTPAMPLRATYEATRPLDTWTFEVRAKSGKVVFRAKGSAANGWLRIAWNGRAAKGKHLPSGKYAWRLTGTGPGGALTTQSGTGIVHGVVRV